MTTYESQESKVKHESKVKVCYMNTNSFVYETETENFYKEIAKDVEKKFDKSG